MSYNNRGSHQNWNNRGNQRGHPYQAPHQYPQSYYYPPPQLPYPQPIGVMPPQMLNMYQKPFFFPPPPPQPQLPNTSVR